MARGEAARRARFESLRAFDRAAAPGAWERGLLAGVDEAGVGPLAGPVVAAAVVLPPDADLQGLDDSKQLSAAARFRLEPLLRATARAVGVARVSPARIDRLHIRRAMQLAHHRALLALGMVPEAVLVDGLWVPRLPEAWSSTRVAAVVDGDARSLAVAAASVIAKVTRDRIMQRLHQRYPQYGFDSHKGYATAEHRQALRLHGLSPVHRRCFCGFLAAEAEMARQAVLDFGAAAPRGA